MTGFPATVVAGSVQDHQVAPDLHGGVTLPRQGLGMENAAVWREVVHEGHEIAGPGRHLRLGLAEPFVVAANPLRSEEHTSELQSLMRISYAVFCWKKKTHTQKQYTTTQNSL